MKAIAERLFFADRLFLLWVASFPFYRYSVVGTLSVDNLLTPLLFLFVPFLRLRSEGILSAKWLIRIGLALFIYFAPQVLPLVVTQGAVWKTIYDLFVDVAYFLVVLLYLGGRPWLRERAENMVVVIMAVGCLTAFLAAIGVLELSVSRYSASRLDIEGLQRTVGLFGVYGDMAILSSFGLIYALSDEPRLAFLKKTRAVVVAAFLVVLLGLLGSQSRNMVLTITLSLVFFWIMNWAGRKGSRTMRRALAWSFGVGFVGLALMAAFGREVVDILSEWGGAAAQGTATARLSQYQLAWSLLKGNWLLGVSAETFERYSADIGYIHNMWLKEAVKGGLLGILGLGMLFAISARRAVAVLMVSPSDGAAQRSLALLVAILVSSQFSPSGTFVFWFMLGLSMACLGGMATPSSGGVHQQVSSVSSRFQGRRIMAGKRR